MDSTYFFVRQVSLNLTSAMSAFLCIVVFRVNVACRKVALRTMNPRIESIERATNQPWDEWLEFMKSIDASGLSHHEIATQVLERLMGKLDNPGWWAQSITVAYEQQMGRRLPGQMPDGTFQTSASRSTPWGMQELMDKWVDFAATDKEVLDMLASDPRVSGTENRITWRAKAKDGSAIIITSEPKNNGTASVIATQVGLQTAELNAEVKLKWVAVLERFLKC